MNEQDIRAGWRIVTVILGLLLLLSVLATLAPLLLGLPLGAGAFIRLALTVGLAWLVYQGRPWARLLLILLLLWSAWQLIAVGLLVGSAGGAVPLGIGLLYLLCGASLFAVPQVNTYFRYVRQD